MKMMSPHLEWLKDRIRIREHEGVECFFFHSEFHHSVEMEEPYEDEK